MSCPPYIVLPKSEWIRLQRQGGPAREVSVDNKREKLEALNELSQEWIKTWPDTVAGHLALLERQKEKQQKLQDQANIEFLKAYTDKEKQEKTMEAIKQAKQQIFQDSNYGRKLLSAQLESRAIDTRDAQIKINKILKEKVDKTTKEAEDVKKGCKYDFHDSDADRAKNEKLNLLECIRVNKEIVSLKHERELQEKLEEKQCAIEEAQLMKQVIEIEKKQKEDIKRCEKQKLEEYEADSKRNALMKAHDEKLADALTEIYRKEQERIKLKSRAVLKEKVHQGRPETKWSKNLYEKVKLIQNEETKRYEDFIDKGIKAYEESILKTEANEKLKEKQTNLSAYLTAQRHRIISDEDKLAKKYSNKCVCERQSLPLKSKGQIKKKCESITDDESSEKATEQKEDKIIRHGKVDTNKKFPFLAPRNKLTEELKEREKEPSPYNSTKATHEYFARQADQVLKEVNHKHFARKVVDEYRKFNSLDATTLPVPNY